MLYLFFFFLPREIIFPAERVCKILPTYFSCIFISFYFYFLLQSECLYVTLRKLKIKKL